MSMKRGVFRRLSSVALAGMLGAALSAGTLAATPDLTAVWKLDGQATQLLTSEGAEPPLNSAGKKLYQKNKKAIAKRDFSVDLTRDRCSAPGAARMMTLPFAIEFFQRPQQLTMLFEFNSLFRLVYIGERKQIPYAYAIGVSNGRWEGETLVVETTDMTDNTLLDSTGLPHSADLKLTERFRLVNPQKLEVTMTISDAKYFSRDWTTKLSYSKTDAVAVDEYNCLDSLENGGPAVPGI